MTRLRHVQWKCFVRANILLDLAYFDTSIQLTAVHFRAHARKSTIHHLSRCHDEFRPIDASLFLSDWKIVWDPTRINFLTINVHANVVAISAGVQHQQLIYVDLHEVRAGVNYSLR